MKTLFNYLIIFLCSFNHALAQDYNIEWGELEGGKGETKDIVNAGNSNYYVFSKVGEAYPTKYISYYEGFVRKKSEKMISKIGGKQTKFIKAEMIGGKLVVFLSTYVKKGSFYYAQKYNTDLSKDGEPIFLADYVSFSGFLVMEKKFDFHSNESSILISKNKDYFVIKWEVRDGKSESAKFAFRVFNNACEEILKGEQELPFKASLIRIDHHHLTNKGEYFISIQELGSPEKSHVYKTYAKSKAVHICKMGSTDFARITLDMKGFRLGQLKIHSDESSILNLIGTFGPEDYSRKNGIFNIQLDFSSEKIIFEKFTKLKQSSLNKKCVGQKCDTKLDINTCEIDECILLESGKWICTLEGRTVKSTPSTNVNSGYLHYFNEIYTFCIDKDGEIEWISEILKKGTGTAVSYSKFLNGDDLVYIFNDNLENYNSKGSFDRKNGPVEEAKWQKKYSMVAIAKVDILNGEIERKKLFDKSTVDAYAFPQKFVVDYENNEVILFCSARNKNKFGLIKLVND